MVPKFWGFVPNVFVCFAFENNVSQREPVTDFELWH